MVRSAADNDILYKGSWFGLAIELLSAIPSTPEETVVLGQARFVVGKRLERQEKKGVAQAADAIAQFKALLSRLNQAEPTAEEQSFAAALEKAAQEAGLPLDSGESLLCAIVVRRRLEKLATGDKRAIAALEALAKDVGDVAELKGKLVCLEQLIARLLKRLDPAVIRTAVCQQAHVDRALASCLGCSSPAVKPEDWEIGLASYIGALRQAAPTLLDT